jgi:glycosyltransferase involved in cell wall biosynthesis
MNDLATFMPQAVERARLIRFVPHIPSDIGEVGSIDVGRRYGLPEQFFLLPNHFLPHKNHAVVLEALGLLAARGCRPVVVCTGQDRTPTAEQVTFRSRELGIESQFIRLGVVPRNEYFYLLRASIAVLNPSQFEGFGLSVPEAGYLGIPLILSDIPALREHAFEKTSYFDPAAPRQLADIMAAHLAQHATRTAAIPLRAWPNEQARFGRELLTIFEEAHHV